MQITYLSSGLVVSLCRRDLLSALVSAGCSHLAIKIFSYLGERVRIDFVNRWRGVALTCDMASIIKFNDLFRP